MVSSFFDMHPPFNFKPSLRFHTKGWWEDNKKYWLLFVKFDDMTMFVYDTTMKSMYYVVCTLESWTLDKDLRKPPYLGRQ
jgi:hypothetical protein